MRGILAGDKKSIARAITIAEDDVAEAQRLISLIFPHTGRAHIIGLTGPGGSGKSTLLDKIIGEFRRETRSVGVVAVDPTSPFTGGAFLGDRIRMQGLSTDEEVFIRSMATRNKMGGIARATRDAVRILDASGKDVIVVETVGAGQSEVEIAKVAHTIVVLFAPGLGDEIQAIKAGLMEIGDIFVVNKADRDNADRAAIDIKAILQMGEKEKIWKPPVLKTIATTGVGVSKLIAKIRDHKSHLEKKLEHSHDFRRAEAELIEALKERTAASIVKELEESGKLEEIVAQIVAKKIDPFSLADKLIKEKITGKT